MPAVMNIRIGDYVTDGEVSGRVVAGPTGSGEFEIRLAVATQNRGWVWRHWKSLTKISGETQRVR